MELIKIKEEERKILLVKLNNIKNYGSNAETIQDKSLYLTPLYNNLPKNEAIPVRDRILYGLPINEETKEKVLQYKY